MTEPTNRPPAEISPLGRGPDSLVAAPERPYASRVDAPTVRAVLRRRYRLMLLSGLSLFGLVAVVTFLMPRKYSSNASFLVQDDQKTADGKALDILRQVGAASNRQTEIELIQSRRVLGPVVDSLGLRVTSRVDGVILPPGEARILLQLGNEAVPGRYEIRRSGDSAIVVRSGAGEERVPIGEDGTYQFSGIRLVENAPESWQTIDLGVTSLSRAIDDLRSRIAASDVRREADLFRLSCEGKTPGQAYDLCRQISDAYLDLKLQMQRAEAATAARFLAEQANQAENKLKRAEDSLATYQRRAGAVALQEQASQQVRQSAELWAQREQIRTERRSMQQLIDRIEDGGGDYRDLVSYPAFLKEQGQIVPRLVEMLIDLETRRSEVAVSRSDIDPEIRALDERIDSIEGQLKSIARGYASSLSSQESSLDQALSTTDASLSGIPERQAETIRLERQVTLYADLYTFLQTRLREAEVAESVELPSVQVVDVASVPSEPSSPRRKLNLAVGLVFAAGMSLMVGLWREYTDTRLHERSAIEFEAGVPVLTMLPHVGKEPVLLPLSRPPGNGSGAPSRGQIEAVQDVALEAMRTLAAELNFATGKLDLEAMQAVAVTSATQGDGKTFTACNLAVAKANQGFRVLLIDADLRGRGASRSFKIPPDTPGLSDVRPNRSYRSVPTVEVQVGDRAVLSIVPSGTGRLTPGELLGGDTFREVMEWGRKYYDFIVVDTPPLSLLSDAATTATLVDGVVVVVRSGKTDRAALEFTLQRLDRAHARTVGIVLNDVEVPEYYRSYAYTG